ncbi:hypothetical protein V1511DRAFT_495780 [Dipodascopsis uninucleata]
MNVLSGHSSWMLSKALMYDTVFESADRRSDNELVRNDAQTARLIASDWQEVTAWASPKALLHPATDSIIMAIGRLGQFGLLDRLLDWYMDTVRSHFAVHALPALKGPEILGESPNSLIEVCATAERILKTLCDAVNHYMHPLSYIFSDTDSMTSTLSIMRFKQSLHAMIALSLNEYGFQNIARNLVRRQLDACVGASDDSGEDENENGMMDEAEKATDRQRMLRSLRLKIDELEIQEFIERIVAEVFHEFMHSYVRDRYTQNWEREPEEKSALEQLKKNVMCPIYQCISALVRKDENEMIANHLYDLAQEIFIRLRVEEMFDMVIYFPDSLPAINDLRMCLKTQEHRAQLVASFQSSCQARLLHCGATTSDIISFYISTIKAFKILESRGVLLDKVSRPIRRYLRERDDTVKCVVSGILEVDDPSLGDLSELASQLIATSGSTQQENGDDNDFFDMNWVPDPVDAAPDFRNKKSVDFLGSFISLYDNKEVFVKEIVVALANRLLDLKSYEIDREMMQLELLKLRFGEAELHSCDVMIKDISESKRADSNIHEISSRSLTSAPVDRRFHASMLSRLFWPIFKNEKLTLPAEVEQQMQSYEERFSVLKSARHLQWLKRLGNVDITLELEDRTIEMTVSPERATVIYLFQERPVFTLAEIMNRTQLDDVAARRSIMFWLKRGVVKEEENKRDTFKLLERAEETNMRTILGETLESSVQTVEDANMEEMRIYWSYIVGMLTNLQSLPIDRIQSFLKMLIPKDMGYARSIDELRDFLTLMVTEEKLEYISGNYRLKK